MFSTAKSPLRRILGVSLLITLHCNFLKAQSPYPNPVLELLRTRSLGIEFERKQAERRLWQQQERRQVPLYNARLNLAVIDFHKHILKDGHYLVTNCSLCRKYVKEIKSYSKKVEQAMK